MTETVDKLVIADQMIEASIVEFLDQERYFSAFNLNVSMSTDMKKQRLWQPNKETCNKMVNYAPSAPAGLNAACAAGRRLRRR